MIIDVDRLQKQSGIIGTSDGIRQVLEMISQVAPVDISVLITGESGSGKEVVAKATHIGGVRNLLMGLKVNGHRTPKERCPVYVNGKKVGFITSAVFSISLGCPIAFAYLRRSFAHAGKFCQIEICEGRTVSAEIVENFTPTIA